MWIGGQMSVLGLPKVTDFNLIFEQSQGKVIPLDLFGNKEQAEVMIKYLFGDVREYSFTFVAKCACGRLNSNAFEGMVCNHCQTECQPAYYQNIDYQGWFVVPEVFPKLIVPIAYWVLHYWLKKIGKVSVLEMLLNPAIPTEFPELGQGLKNFHDNFDSIVAFFQSQKKYYNPKIDEFLLRYRHQIFTDKIPVINDGLHVITNAAQGSGGRKTDNVSPILLELKTDLDSLFFDFYTKKRPLKQSQVDKRMFNVQQTWITYMEQLWDTKIFGKPGLFRKNVVSGRMHFTFRAVCVPITEIDFGDEAYLPAKIATVLYKTMIIQKLISRGYSPVAAQLKYHLCKEIYDEEIEDILYELIEECPYKGLPVFIQRNPSLRQGAAVLVFITKIKYDDDTISVSDMYISGMNMDFDGDNGNGLSIREMQLVPDLYPLHPAMTMASRAKAGMSGYVKISDPAAVCANNWLLEEDA
jgi:hypothetical protein